MPQNVLAVHAKDNASHTSCMFYVTHHRHCDLRVLSPSATVQRGWGGGGASLSAINTNNDTLSQMFAHSSSKRKPI